MRTYTDPTLPELHVQPELVHKILVVGGARVGKTSITRFYAEKDAGPYNQTVGSDLYVVPYGVLCGRQVYIKLIDVGHAEIAGTSSFLSIVTANVSGVLLVFDVGNPHSLTEIDAWVATLKAHVSGLGVCVPVLVLAHKADLIISQSSPQFVSSEDLTSYVKANNFTGWRWTSTRFVPGKKRLASSISDAVHSLVESILVRAAENNAVLHNRRALSITSEANLDAAGTLEQLLSHHNEATYVQIPNISRPGDAQLAIDSAVIRSGETMHCFHFLNDSRKHLEQVKGAERMKIEEDEKVKDDARDELTFDDISTTLEKCMRQIADEPHKKSVRYQKKIFCALRSRLEKQRSAAATLQSHQTREWQRVLQLCDTF